jgi:hypothetical protein
MLFIGVHVIYWCGDGKIIYEFLSILYVSFRYHGLIGFSKHLPEFNSGYITGNNIK